jgi:hypothetical protein
MPFDLLPIDANVISARYSDTEIVLDLSFWVPEYWVDGPISNIEEVKIRVQNISYIIGYQSLSLRIEYKIILLVIVENDYKVINLNEVYETSINKNVFTPPLSLEEWRTEVSEAYISILRWITDAYITDPSDNLSNLQNYDAFCPIPGTMLRIVLYAGISIDVGRPETVVVLGEIEEF